jgi:hypothetical protein
MGCEADLMGNKDARRREIKKPKKRKLARQDVHQTVLPNSLRTDASVLNCADRTVKGPSTRATPLSKVTY